MAWSFSSTYQRLINGEFYKINSKYKFNFDSIGYCIKKFNIVNKII